MHVAVFSSCCTCSIRGEHLGHLDTSSKYIHCISNSPLSSWSNPAPVVATQNESWHFSHDRDLKRGISMNQYDFACYTWILLNSIAFYGATCLAAGFIYIYIYVYISLCCMWICVYQNRPSYGWLSKEKNKLPQQPANHSTPSQKKEHQLALGFYLLCRCLGGATFCLVCSAQE